MDIRKLRNKYKAYYVSESEYLFGGSYGERKLNYNKNK